MGSGLLMGFINCEVGLGQMGLIFLLHHILDQFLHPQAPVGGGAAAVVAEEVAGKDWLIGIGSKEKVGVLYMGWWWWWCNGGGGGG